MASVRRKGGKNYYYRYRDENGKLRERKGSSDRRVTEQLATEAEARVARIKLGMIDPRAEALAAHDARPLAGHLDDWHAYLIAKASTRQHATLSRNRVRRLIDAARARRIGDLAPSRVQAA